MTRTLATQKERLVQTERVAAWRELARRLAHELRNPLFPLQITVENMQRAFMIVERSRGIRHFAAMRAFLYLRNRRVYREKQHKPTSNDSFHGIPRPHAPAQRQVCALSHKVFKSKRFANSRSAKRPGHAAGPESNHGTDQKRATDDSFQA